MSSNLDAIFKPKTIAVVGASNKPGSIGNVIVNNLLRYEYKGKIFPVNPKADKIEWLQCYPSVSAIPEAIDLAIIVVPRNFVASALEECGQKGVKGVVTITAGFKEIGGEGKDKEQELIEIVKKYGMRMVGPNCYGVVNSEADISLNCTFSKLNPPRGGVAFMSQSGALGEVVIDYTSKLNIGFAQFASVGNKADISDIDILRYWKDDPGCEMILLYLENVENAQQFVKLAKEITHKKPVFAVKTGRSKAGAKAIGSHTGVLAGGDAATDAVFKQCGIIRTDSIDELFDAAMAFTHQPLLKGDRIAVITNAGGPGILATDAVEMLGLKMATFDPETIKYLRANLLPMAAVNNPIDVIASGGPDAYAAAMEAVLTDKNVDGVICIFVPPILVDSNAVLGAIADKIKKHGNNKTVLACLMGSPDGVAGSDLLSEINVPSYLFPESAARALKAMHDYHHWLNRRNGEQPDFKIAREQAEKLIKTAVRDDKKAILGRGAFKLLQSYGIAIAKIAAVKTTTELNKALIKIKPPVVMKIDDPSISHKSDVRGVLVGLKTRADILKAFQGMKRKFGGPKKDFAGVVIQEMVEDGIETIIGMNQDPTFGPVMMFGLGGVYVEILKDVSLKLNPLTDIDAEEMIKSIKGYPLLAGARGRKAIDIEVLKETLMRLSRLVTDFPEIKSIDINPFMANTERKKSKAVDARFILG